MFGEFYEFVIIKYLLSLPFAYFICFLNTSNCMMAPSLVMSDRARGHLNIDSEAFRVLQEIASYGVVSKYDWRTKTRELVRQRIIECLDNSNDRMGFVAPVDQSFEKRRDEVCDLLNCYEYYAPFTIQRLAEVLLAPAERQYCATHKLCNAVEKLLSVSSSAPCTRRQGCDNLTGGSAIDNYQAVQPVRRVSAQPGSNTPPSAIRATTSPTSKISRSPTVLSLMEADGATAAVTGSPGGSPCSSHRGVSSISDRKYVHISTPTATGKTAGGSGSRKRPWDEESDTAAGSGSGGVNENRSELTDVNTGTDDSYVCDDSTPDECKRAKVEG